MTPPRLAIVFCAHHKPWLMMSSLVTLLSQDRPGADLFVVYNVGDGTIESESYREYRGLVSAQSINTQLSPFDPRVRDVCQMRGHQVVELEYENDQALDSGTWYKFIRDGRWRDYDYTLFVGEGTLFAHPRLLSGLLDFATQNAVHFVASGHEKRRLPRTVWDQYIQRGRDAKPLDVFHDRMITESFRIFARDPEFRRVYDRWGADFAVETEHHVPQVALDGPLARKARARIQRRWGSPSSAAAVSWVGRWLRQLPPTLDRWNARMSLAAGLDAGMETPSGPPLAYSGGRFDTSPVGHAVDAATVNGVGFHRVDGPEWFGCATNHLMSREFLERFTRKLEAFQMYDVLGLPFAGTPLEVIWGMLPAWLGTEKWFTNGFHRVRKNFATYQREDDPAVMASYINRYHRGRLVVAWEGDFLKLRAWRPDLGDLRRVLPAAYF